MTFNQYTINTVPCSYCLVDKGYPCVTAGGYGRPAQKIRYPVGYVHKARSEQAFLYPPQLVLPLTGIP